ncbi:MAG TPA: trehalose-phosphatase [Spongiibacteraceae bacterium]
MRDHVVKHSFPLSRVYEYPASLPPPPIPTLEAQWALFLDVDGTLLEFAPTPDAVIVPEGLVDLLTRLRTRLNGALALVSGRRIEALDQLLAPLQLPAAGLHGLERRDALGHEYRAPIDTAALDAMRAAAYRLAETLPSVLLEDKHFSIAFHFRAAKLQQPALRSGVEAIARQTGFSLQAGVDVYELKPPGTNKGGALAAFMRDSGFKGRLPIYIGDDLTDEHALAAAQQFAGMGIHVGSLMPSAAHFGLPGPGAVLHWLRRWEEQLS